MTYKVYFNMMNHPCVPSHLNLSGKHVPPPETHLKLPFGQTGGAGGQVASSEPSLERLKGLPNVGKQKNLRINYFNNVMPIIKLRKLSI